MKLRATQGPPALRTNKNICFSLCCPDASPQIAGTVFAAPLTLNVSTLQNLPTFCWAISNDRKSKLNKKGTRNSARNWFKY